MKISDERKLRRIIREEVRRSLLSEGAYAVFANDVLQHVAIGVDDEQQAVSAFEQEANVAVDRRGLTVYEIPESDLDTWRDADAYDHPDVTRYQKVNV